MVKDKLLLWSLLYLKKRKEKKRNTVPSGPLRILEATYFSF